MSKVTALISDERPVIRIYGGDTDDHVEIQFETKSDANVAVERLNELFKTATGLVFRLGCGGRRPLIRIAADDRSVFDGTEEVPEAEPTPMATSTSPALSHRLLGEK